MKIVGVGLNKTGTKSLGVCMRHWGFEHISCSEDAFNLWRSGNYIELLKWVDRFDSFEDWPWPLFYKKIDENFPFAKFILTKRINAEVWYESLCRHADLTGPTDYRKYIYGYEMPHEHKDHHIKIYENHLASVREHFRNRPSDFLEVCWEDGDGWEELSRFLGLECSVSPFPHENKNSSYIKY